MAKPTNGITQILDKLEGKRFTCEWKYDGVRAQIHVKPDGTMQIFSRNMDETTGQFPDIVKALPGAAWDTKGDNKLRTAVLDAEVVAWDNETQKLLPFQAIMTRKRKAVSEAEVTVQVIVQACSNQSVPAG